MLREACRQALLEMRQRWFADAIRHRDDRPREEGKHAKRRKDGRHDTELDFLTEREEKLRGMPMAQGM